MASQQKTTSSSRPAKRKRGFRFWVAVVAGVGVAGFLALPLLNRPPGPKADKKQVAMFIASPDFQRMTQQQKAEYVERILEDPQAFTDMARDNSLPPIAREHLLHAVSVVQLNQRAERYATMSAKDRKPFIDDLINDQERARQQMPRGAAPGGERLTDQQRGERIKAQLEHTSPEEATRVAALMADVNKRRAERGLAPVAAGPEGSGNGQGEAGGPPGQR